ncbi:Cytochrome c 2.1 [Aphelenchoides besseyi]|nr:Cytochrome c 2.1 [Aphelenchoides besseyi]
MSNQSETISATANENRKMSIADEDFEKGKEVFITLCSRCHEVSSMAKKTGPSLKSIVGRKSGQVSTFSYLEANENKF